LEEDVDNSELEQELEQEQEEQKRQNNNYSKIKQTTKKHRNVWRFVKNN